MTLIYNVNVYDEELIDRIAGYYLTAIRRMLDNLDHLHNSHPLLGRNEQIQRRSWNASHVEYPCDLCIHELFEDQVKRTPSNIAVSQEGRALTYLQLNERSRRLSRYLAQHGVREGTRVGIYLGRSFEQLIGLLGVMKAGGAYVALEAGLPRERIKYQLADAGINSVLTCAES